MRYESFVYILHNSLTNKYTAVHIDIDKDIFTKKSSKERSNLIEQEVAKLLIGHPDYLSYEVINSFPLDEMGYFEVHNKLVLT